MTNLQLVLTIGIPSLLILVGMFLNNSRSNTLEGRIDRLGSELNARIDRMQADLSQFYMILGRHEADIATLKEARRRA
jgi:hypothetical protein